MKFGSLLLSFIVVMEILNDSDVPFGDTLFYLEKDGKLYTYQSYLNNDIQS